MATLGLGLVLEHFLARHASMHSHTATVLASKPRGHIAIRPSPPRTGTLGVI